MTYVKYERSPNMEYLADKNRLGEIMELFRKTDDGAYEKLNYRDGTWYKSLDAEDAFHYWGDYAHVWTVTDEEVEKEIKYIKERQLERRN